MSLLLGSSFNHVNPFDFNMTILATGGEAYQIITLN